MRSPGLGARQAMHACMLLGDRPSDRTSERASDRPTRARPQRLSRARALSLLRTSQPLAHPATPRTKPTTTHPFTSAQAQFAPKP
eukprot:scaffold584_cov343-Prasinococcus_capsulatus_cf.AAC.10